MWSFLHCIAIEWHFLLIFISRFFEFDRRKNASQSQRLFFFFCRNIERREDRIVEEITSLKKSFLPQNFKEYLRNCEGESKCDPLNAPLSSIAAAVFVAEDEAEESDKLAYLDANWSLPVICSTGIQVEESDWKWNVEEEEEAGVGNSEVYLGKGSWSSSN